MGRKETAKHLSLPPEFNAKLLSTATGCRPRVICADSMGTRYFGNFMENACRLSPENLEPQRTSESGLRTSSSLDMDDRFPIGHNTFRYSGGWEDLTNGMIAPRV